jgi:hypothetical protein
MLKNRICYKKRRGSVTKHNQIANWNYFNLKWYSFFKQIELNIHVLNGFEPILTQLL